MTASGAKVALGADASLLAEAEPSPAAPSTDRLREIAAGWPVAVTAMLGVGTGMTLLVYGFSAFIAPMSAEMGWSPASVSVAPAFMSMTTLLLGAATGRLADRIGVRKIMLPSILLFGAALAALSLLRGPVSVFYLGYGCAAALGMGTSAITYTRVVGTWFNHARGLALGVATTGAGLSALILPPLLSRVIHYAGWRAGWVACGVIAWSALLPAWLFLRERAGAGPAYPRSLAGMTMRQAAADRHFWLLAASSLLVSTIGGGTVVHLLSMLEQAGLSRAEAADRAALLGIGIITGRLATGFLLDRLPGRLIAFTLVAAAAAGFVLLHAGGAAAPAAVLLIGMTIGSEGDMLAFFTSRYFGMRSYAEIYGWLYVLFSCGSATGPLLIAALLRGGASYAAVYAVYATLALVAAALMLMLGRYRFQRGEALRGAGG